MQIYLKFTYPSFQIPGGIINKLLFIFLQVSQTFKASNDFERWFENFSNIIKSVKKGPEKNSDLDKYLL